LKKNAPICIPSKSIYTESIETIDFFQKGGMPIMDASQSSLKRPNEKALALLEEWLTDTSGYDEQAWPRLLNNLDIHRLSERKRIDDETHPAGHGASREDHASTA